MAINSAIIDAIAQAVGDAAFVQRTKEVYAAILTDSQDYLVEKLEVLEKVDISIALEAGKQEYALPDAFIAFPSNYTNVKRGDIVLGASGTFQLKSTSIQLLNGTESGWRSAAAGTPERYYLVKEGARKIGFYPAPSVAYITANTNKVWMSMVYRPTAIGYDSSKPFDNSFALQGLQYLLKLRALWQICVEDKKFEDADRFEMKISKELEKALDKADSEISTPGEHGFVENVGSYMP